MQRPNCAPRLLALALAFVSIPAWLAAQDGRVMIVLDGSAITGIMSERDYARKVILLGRSSHDLRVTDIMTSPVVCADPEWSTHDCMRMMTDHRVRHLPVVEAGRLVGVVSIGDVVRSVLEEQAQTIQTLESYISSGG